MPGGEWLLDRHQLVDAERMLSRNLASSLQKINVHNSTFGFYMSVDEWWITRIQIAGTPARTALSRWTLAGADAHLQFR